MKKKKPTPYCDNCNQGENKIVKAKWRCPQCTSFFCDNCEQRYAGECPMCDPPVLQKIKLDKHGK